MPEEQDLPSQVLEAFICTFIEHGTVEVGNRSVEEILNDCGNHAARVTELGDDDLGPITDHRSTLFSRAQSEATSGDRQIAATLFAVWIEHTVNGCLKTGFTRKGYDDEAITQLIRWSNLETKLTTLWRVIGFTPISKAHLNLINQIVKVRNNFVHYKWQSYDLGAQDDEDAKIDNLNSKATELWSVFDSAMNELHWNGRKGEIIAYYRSSWKYTPREDSG